MRIAGREPAERGDFVQLVGVEQLEDRLEEVEAELARIALDLFSRASSSGREVASCETFPMSFDSPSAGINGSTSARECCVERRALDGLHLGESFGPSSSRL